MATPDFAKQVIDSARTQVGVHEGKSNGRWNNRQRYSKEVPGLEWSDGQPWCATFVAWNAMKGGASDLYPRTASCDVGGNWFKSRGQWSEHPAVGAQVFYGTPRDLNHTGIVYAYDDDYIYAIEGNTNDSGSREGDGVYLKKRARRGANVIGYGYPAFPLGIQNADPKRQNLLPKTKKYVRADNPASIKPKKLKRDPKANIYVIKTAKEYTCKTHKHVLKSSRNMFAEVATHEEKMELVPKVSDGYTFGAGGYTEFKKLKRQADTAFGKDVQRSTVVVVKVFSNTPNAKKILMAAHRAGFKTVLLPRGTRRISKKWWPYVDYVRGAVIWVD